MDRRQRGQSFFTIRVGQLELHQRRSDHRADTAIGFQLFQVGFLKGADDLSGVEISQLIRPTLGLFPGKEQAIRLAHPHVLGGPSLQHHLCLWQTTAGNRVNRRPDRLARAFGDDLLMLLQDRLQTGLLRVGSQAGAQDCEARKE